MQKTCDRNLQVKLKIHYQHNEAKITYANEPLVVDSNAIIGPVASPG